MTSVRDFPSTPDLELLDDVYEFIESHPELWEQTCWRSKCGTQFCFAGTVAEVVGAQWADVDWHGDGPDAGSYNVLGRDYRYNDIRVDDGWMHVEDFARQRLGITVDEARELFDGLNDLDMLRQAVELFHINASQLSEV
jgi:hypothetical protein